MDRLRREAAHSAAGKRGSFGSAQDRFLALRQGIGDDCAVLSYSRQNDLLVTTDLFLEGVHFRRDWQEPASAGHKALARGLSDIAAMGGVPRFAFLSLALPLQIEERWVNAFLRGLLRLAKQSRVTLAGGDTGASPMGVVADVMVIGEAPRNRALLRSGARPGHEIWVTGQLGGAARALELLRNQSRPSTSSGPRAEPRGDRQGAGLLPGRTAPLAGARGSDYRKGKKIPDRAAALQPLFYPQPRLRMGQYLCEHRLASAMIDLSDGLSIDLARLCQASGVGARIEEAALPRAPDTPLECALHGGEDHELLLTVPPERARHLPKSLGGVPFTRIGQIVRGGKLRLARGGKERPLPVRGFEHF